MTPYILPLATPNATLDNVGGKGLSLAKMLAAGMPVPGGFHVTTEAYRQFVAGNIPMPHILEELAVIDPADLPALETASSHIQGFFAAGKIPPEIASAISTAYEDLKAAPVAVRSSATAEDLPGASFAGQQETYLNIQGTQAVLEAVKKCWASLWTPRAIAYRINNHIPQDTVALAVVVQELVFAAAAGIMFTANPVNGRRDELVINAAWGLGEAVVSGAVTPDTLIIAKATGKVMHRETAEKAIMTVRTQHGTHEVPVPETEKKKAVLTAAQTAELARLGVQIEQFYQAPMDIEWALAGEKFFIVQARPITALPPEWIIPDPTGLYTRGSLAEHTPSPVTPLFGTLGLEIIEAATLRIWERTVGNGYQVMVPQGGLFKILNGYIYQGARMRGRAAVKIITMTIGQIGPILRGSVARWRAAERQFSAVVAEWEQKLVEQLSPSQLLQGAQTVFSAACHYYTEIQTTLPAASSSEILFTKLYDSLIRRRQDPPALTFLMGSETIALRAEKSLFDIAGWAAANQPLADYIRQATSETLAADLACESAPAALPASLWTEWRARMQSHLDEYGRTAFEFDFSFPTARETPGPMLDTIKAFLEGKANSPYQRQREALEKREQATQAVLARTGWPIKGWFLKLLRWAQDTGPMREDSIFDMGMGHPLLRRMFAELGSRLVAGGAITQPDDIYWLEKVEVEELTAALESGSPLPDLSGHIPARKAQWQAALKITPPVMLPEKTGWLKLIHGGEAEKQDGKLVLKGVGTSGGVVKAPACVVFGPEDFGKLNPGDVLVAVTTTPAWTPLFSRASAVVTDIGGPLSHSSIVAREYGIPAVMAARSATRLIQTGQLVSVDGNTGRVTLEG